jgi:hypothetical protein
VGIAGLIAISIEKYATIPVCPGFSREPYGSKPVNSVCCVISHYS